MTTSSDTFEAFVTKFSGGNDNWFPVANNFDTSAAHWSRSGWELVAVRNQHDTDRHGIYVNAKGHSVYVKINSLHDWQVVHTPAPA